MKISTKPISPWMFILRVLLLAAVVIFVHSMAGTEDTFFYQGF